MNLYGIETFLIGSVASVLVAAFLIHLRNRAPKPHKIPHTPTFRQSQPTFQAPKSKTTDLPKKIELETTIAGYLSIYPIVRPEAPLL